MWAGELRCLSSVRVRAEEGGVSVSGRGHVLVCVRAESQDT